MIYYNYLWLREDGTPYYAGKGKGSRAFGGRHSVHKPTEDNRILIQEHPDEESAFEAERFLISYYGRKDLGTGCLYNLTDGGEGGDTSTGKKRSEKAKANISAGLKASSYQFSIKPENRWKGGFRGTHTQETRRKISESKRGKPTTSTAKISEFSDFLQWVALPIESREPQRQSQLARKLGVSSNTISNWMKISRILQESHATTWSL